MGDLMSIPSEASIVIIGGGISGVIAAKLSAEKKLNTILLDDKKDLGGVSIYNNDDNFKISRKFI